jgi:hypothetical protein
MEHLYFDQINIISFISLISTLCPIHWFFAIIQESLSLQYTAHLFPQTTKFGVRKDEANNLKAFYSVDLFTS